MTGDALVEIGTLLIYVELLADALGLAEPTIVFKLLKVEGAWEAAVWLGGVHEEARDASRADALSRLAEGVRARVERVRAQKGDG